MPTKTVRPVGEVAVTRSPPTSAMSRVHRSVPAMVRFSAVIAAVLLVS